MHEDVNKWHQRPPLLQAQLRDGFSTAKDSGGGAG
jgi:hypothetical protein